MSDVPQCFKEGVTCSITDSAAVNVAFRAVVFPYSISLSVYSLQAVMLISSKTLQ